MIRHNDESTAHYFQAASRVKFIEIAAKASASFMSQRVKKMNEVILHKVLSGQASAVEKARLENWIFEDPARIVCVEKMELIWELAGNTCQQIDPDSDAEWLKLQKRMAAISRAEVLHKDEAKLVAMHPKGEILKKAFVSEAAVC
ncbi:MAG: hypothetical protein AAB316_17260 [Bacteroidota bacterium]